jgi:hypothetical protein
MFSNTIIFSYIIGFLCLPFITQKYPIFYIWCWIWLKEQYSKARQYKTLLALKQTEETIITQENTEITQEDDQIVEKETESTNQISVYKNPYEDKYLTKYKNFPNEFYITESDLLWKNETYKKLKLEDEQNWITHLSIIDEQRNKLYTMDRVLRDTLGTLIFAYYEVDYEEDEEDKETDDYMEEKLNELKTRLKIEYDEELQKLEELQNKKITRSNNELLENAQELLIEKKKADLINSFILEYTPLGNVYMRYNTDKDSFEYFCNNNMPYRFLEPIGRKYVTTFFCKPLFVDIEEELKKAKERPEVSTTTNSNSTIYSQIKMMSADSKMMQQRKEKSFTLPPQIQKNIKQLHGASTEKLVVKENANRYTWEGRLSNMALLKTVDRKLVDKNYGLTFADFKRIHAKS